MAATEEILGQFLGDAAFPVTWDSEVEKDFFWVYDDLHMPAPGQPDVLRHRRLVAELRPHVPALRDAVRGRLAGQERQRLRLHDGHPGRSRPAHRRDRVQRPLRRPGAARRRVRHDDGRLPRRRPARLRPRLRRLVAGPPAAGDGAQLRLPRGAPRRRRGDGAWPTWPACSRTPSTSTIATGRSTGCSTSPSCRRRSSCGRSWRRPAAAVDEALLGRLQNSASDRNWDSIEALWRMKNEVRDDAELRAAFASEDTAPRSPRPCGRANAAGGSSPSGSSRTSASSAGTPSGATSSSSRRSASRWSRSSSSSAATSTTDYDFPSAIEAMRHDIEAASREILEGLTGEALEEMQAANEVNLRMAPLTPDHHFYIDQGANAHMRLVLLAVGQKLVDARPARPAGRRACSCATTSCGRSSAAPRRSPPASSWPTRRREREAADAAFTPRDWIGTVHARRSWPSRTSSTGATPSASTRRSRTTSG